MYGYVDDSGNTAVGDVGAGATNVNGTTSDFSLGNLFGGGGLGTGLGLSALGTLLGTYANQGGISKASDLINQYGQQAVGGLNTNFANQIAQNQANQSHINDVGNYAQGLMQNTLGNQVAYGNQMAQTYGANANAGQNQIGNIYGAQQGQANANQNNLANLYNTTQNQLGGVYNQQLGFQSPYQTTGQVGANALVANVPYLTNQFNASDLNAQLAPNYQFSLQQGQMANQRAANALGGGFGGNALQGLNNYTQNYAQNAYQQAFNNYQNQRNNIYSTLAGMAGIGTTSGGQLASLGNTYGSNLGNLSSNLGGNLTSNTGNLLNAGNTYSGNTTSLTNALNNALVANAGQVQGAYNNYGSNIGNLANTNVNASTTGSNALLGAGTQYGTNLASLATGLGGAQAQNAVAAANANAGALQSIGNTALLGSILGSRPAASSGGGGGGGGLGGLLGSIGSIFSDIRMKENIEFVEQTNNGINIYAFDYKPEFKDIAGHGRFRGVMAQEIEKVIPDAVKTMFNGFKAVDYSLVFPGVNHA